jgi:adenylate cyclase
MERRLAAILLTDMVGSSRLMGLDEEGTIARQKAHRAEVFDPKISDHSGRIVKSTGDGLLVVFPSVVDAVKCAVEVQTELQERDVDLPGDRRIKYRIGINLGDIVVDGDDILGDGVNVAARLEALAEPGGICVSGSVYDHLAGKLDVVFEDAGEQTVKNVSRPVRVWHWAGQERQAVVEASGFPETPPLPDKPSIAVLPFNSISDEVQFEYLADGLSEDITTLLARLPSLFVISRNSAFSYKGTSPDIREVGRQLGVRYVVEGSLRPMGPRLRIAVQLIDASTGQHIWARRFDHPVDTIYELQDDIAEAIVSYLQPELTRVEFELVQRRSPSNYDSWTCYQHASALLSLKGWREQTFKEAEGFYRKSIALDANFAPAYASLSLLLALGHLFGHISEPDEALTLAEKALELDSNSSEVLGHVGCALADLGHTDRGIEILEQAIQNDPSNAQALVALGGANLVGGQRDAAVEYLSRGLRISPRDYRLAVWGGIYALALGLQGRFEDAIDEARIACRRDGKLHNPRVILASLLLRTGREKEAKSALKEARRIYPELTLREVAGLVGRRSAKDLCAIWD